jgi:methyl-accepting chemotaxis protein
VRALAQRSSEAAREINGLISASGAQVKRGVDLVDQAGDALKGIVESVMEISRNVSEIAVSSREQSSGLVEINAAMNQLDQVTQQNAAMFEETTAASHALTREAETLTRTMGRFQTGQGKGRPSAEVVTPSFQSQRAAPAAPASAGGADRAPSAPAKVAAAAGGSQSNASFDDDDGWDEF